MSSESEPQKREYKVRLIGEMGDIHDESLDLGRIEDTYGSMEFSWLLRKPHERSGETNNYHFFKSDATRVRGYLDGLDCEFEVFMTYISERNLLDRVINTGSVQARVVSISARSAGLAVSEEDVANGKIKSM
jgi:hypothetical protein